MIMVALPVGLWLAKMLLASYHPIDLMARSIPTAMWSNQTAAEIAKNDGHLEQIDIRMFQ